MSNNLEMERILAKIKLTNEKAIEEILADERLKENLKKEEKLNQTEIKTLLNSIDKNLAKIAESIESINRRQRK
ncbi:MAG: hypothetical protein M0P71_07420 [Melioribacteraceae bacterium]|jgi:hypothetical protein|nr:hypothetical protein [Melioribacteraceae bacterium]MDD3982816.1 hypothetical protein [Candidatus Omnitrophota bacterium]